MTKCEYPGCNAEAKFKLGLADPDAEGSFYCEGHVDRRRQEIMIELFTGDRRCVAITGDGNQCLNAKKFGDYCGIHAKHKGVIKNEKPNN